MNALTRAAVRPLLNFALDRAMLLPHLEATVNKLEYVQFLVLMIPTLLLVAAAAVSLAA